MLELDTTEREGMLFSILFLAKQAIKSGMEDTTHALLLSGHALLKDCCDQPDADDLVHILQIGVGALSMKDSELKRFLRIIEEYEELQDKDKVVNLREPQTLNK